MSKVSFSGKVGPREIVQSEMQLIFSDILSSVNTDKITPDQVRLNAVRRRHMVKPPDIYIRKRVVGTLIFNPAIDKGGTNWTWSTAVIAHDPSLGSMNGPVAVVRASYISHEFEVGSYEIGIGYSTDGGSSYTYFPGTAKTLGYRNAFIEPLWDARVAHPITGVATTYWPNSMYGQAEVQTDVALMDVSGGPSVHNITHLCLGIRCNHSSGAGNGTKNEHALDVAEIYMTARDVL